MPKSSIDVLAFINQYVGKVEEEHKYVVEVTGDKINVSKEGSTAILLAIGYSENISAVLNYAGGCQLLLGTKKSDTKFIPSAYVATIVNGEITVVAAIQKETITKTSQSTTKRSGTGCSVNQSFIRKPY